MAQDRKRELSAICIYASSEDENYAGAELTHVAGAHSGRQRGWQSAKFSEYPQELGFRLDGEAGLNQLQILGHQSKTPTRVDVFVFSLAENGYGSHNPPAYHEATWKRLGYLTFSNNEGSKYKSRERKTVPLDTNAYYLKLVLHKNHQNKVNVYNQVGLISVAVLGEVHYAVNAHAPENGQLVLPPVRPAHHHQQPMEASPRQPQIARQQDIGPPPRYEEDNVYAMVSPPPAAKKRPQKGALPPIKPRDPSYPQSRSPNSYPQAGQTPTHRQAPEHVVGQNTYSEGQYENDWSAPQIQQGFQQPQSLGGLINYRSQRILEFEGFYLSRTRDLSAQKAQAIQTEDFDAAKAAKEQLVFLQTSADRIYELEQTKIRCIYDEDFEAATMAKTEMDQLSFRATEALTRVAQTGMNLSDALREVQQGQPRNRGRAKPQPQQQSDSVQSSGMNIGTSNPSTIGEEPKRHAFEDQPVQSKYAQMMAEQAEAKRRQEEVEPTEDPSAVESEPTSKKSVKKREAKPSTREDDEAESDDEGQRDHDSSADGSHNDNDPSAEEEDEDEEREEDEEEAKPRRTKTSAKPDEVPGEEQPHMNESQEPHFDIEHFEEWEKDVYFAIQDETGKENPEPPAEPLSRSEPISVDIQSGLGQYTTACLFSKRWKLRDAAIKVVSQFLSLYYTKHASALQIVNAVLKYIDMKGFGLLDPIQQVFFSACEFVTKVIDSRFDGASFSTCQSGVLNVLPRLVLRGGDATPKTREEALTVIFAIAASPIGADRVAMAMLAEPVDHDKRRMNSIPARVHVARLLVMQHLMNNHGLGRTMGVDSLMTRLLVPCLNNSSSEVRDLAVIVVGNIDDAKGPDVLRHLPQVKNPNTRAVIEDRLAHPTSDNEAAAPEPQEEKKVVKPKKKR